DGENYAHAGECVLVCPDRKSLVFAALGGSVVNLLTGLAVWMAWILKGDLEGRFYSLKSVGWMVFVLSSLLMAFLSLFFRWKGEENDGLMAWKLYWEERFCKKMEINQQRDMLRLEFGLVEEMF
ncbi:MAG: hypothetical protein K2N63_07490, partial [Lachnospiraceae bacterium]|nr:hypothetical protein [Lachnospiraceae bacterium]